MHDDRPIVEQRLRRILDERIRPAIHAHAVPLELEVWHAGGEPVPVADALTAPYTRAAVGEPWGPAWGTTWFRLTGEVPAAWAGRTVEAIVDPGFVFAHPGFQCEGLAYTADGVPIKGINPLNTWVRIGDSVAGGEKVSLLVEAAANPVILFGKRGDLGVRETAGDDPLYRVTRMDLAVFDEPVWELVQDLEVLDQLMRELGTGEPRRWEILRAIERALDAVDLAGVSATAGAARAELAGVLARPAHASAHRLSAVGHAHIDSAWLWPLRETVRKVARTAANVTALMDDHPDLVFAMSQAQQLAWLRDHHPELYERVRERVASGRFVPVGGMWVESDTNLPGGEALARQFAYGKRFFLEEFGLDTPEVWLPDSFGYSAALPQLVRLSGSRWFLTQKISWNQTNRFPHHTFLWEGLDGTRVFTHFPPVDTYNSELSGAELAHASRNFGEKGRATHSLVPFGWGDGGGGPTREMLARARRTADLEGSPRVRLATPAEFFADAEREYADPPVWSGELYLEFHRGTYTSQARTKRGNRRSEHLLREAELWSATADVAGLVPYPHDALDRLWKTVLLHQFHDILPGTSIAWVHREAEDTYGRVAAELEEIAGRARRALAGSGEATIVFNAAPHPLPGVPSLGAGEPSATAGSSREAVSSGAAGLPGEGSRETGGRISVGEDAGSVVLDNGELRVTVDERGLITSIHDRRAGREVIAPGQAANLLRLHPDLPNAWDAWDVDAFYRNRAVDLVEVESLTVEEEPGAVAVLVTRRFGASRVTQRLSLRAGRRQVEIDTEVDWQEEEKFLKAVFPIDVRADRSASEIQFGHVHRPVHTNTSWDAARFEICAHRWLHVGEPGYGVAIVNDSTYGHDVTTAPRTGGGTATTVRLSLLRAPRFPDPSTDQGVHRMRYAIVPGATIADAVREGYHFNLPPRAVTGAAGPVEPLVAVSDPAVVVEAVRLADDRSGDVIVRLYESLGGRATARVTPSFPVYGVGEVDLLDRPLAADALAETDALAGTDALMGTGTSAEAGALGEPGGVLLRLRPFQIVTLRLRRHP